MKVRDVMTTPVVTVRPDATFADLVDQLLTHDISASGGPPGRPALQGD